MQENTNKSLAINSLILYAKMGITTLCALFATRFALAALGVEDFGLFSVLGSIISFVGLFNTIMLSSTNRFLSVAVGKGDSSEINKVFNVNRVIFLCTSVLVLLIAFPVGTWYIHRYINYSGDISNALMVFYISIIGSVISSIGIPYNGLLMAKEKFIVFSSVEIASNIIKLVISWLILQFFDKKLFVYSLTVSFTTGLPTIIYFIYCNRHYKECVSLNFVKESTLYKEIFKFSGWVAYGAVAFVAKAQGAALLVNAFFNTVMNTALGLANTVISFVTIFANNITQPMQPQITKSYAVGNIERTNELLVMSTRFSFLLMLLVGTPFFVGCEWIMHLWLGEIPPYVVSFTLLLIIDNIVLSFNSGVPVLIFADGRIAVYQVIVNTLRLVAIVVAYIVLKMGTPPEALLITYIGFSAIIVIVTQLILRYTLKFDNSILVKKSYLPSLMVLVCFLPILLMPDFLHPFVKIVIACLYLLMLEMFIGMNKKERNYILDLFTSKIRNRK